MEGVPRIPLGAVSPFIGEEFDFSESLQILITSFYELDFSSFVKSVDSLNELRRNSLSPSLSSTSTIKQYLCQLNMLRGRFNQENITPDSFPLEFTWTNPVSRQKISSNEIEGEMGTILFNIGSMYSSLAVAEDRATADSLKVACTHYLCAAWCFQAIPEVIGAAFSPIPTDGLNVLQNLMLAQAQQCILEKSFLDHRNPIAVAKIAMQICDYYSQCERISSSLSEKLYTNKCNPILRPSRLQFLQLYYEAICVVERGKAANDSKRYGEAVSLFQAAVAKLQKCTKTLDRDWGYKEALAFTLDVAEGHLQAANRDNEHIYHERVPPFESLEPVKGACLVKPIAFDLTDTEIAGKDLFAALVPISVTTASSVYSEEKAKLVRDIGSQIEVKTKELDDFIAAVTPDLAVFDSTSLDNLPPELIELCAALSVDKTVVHRLVELMKQLATMANDFNDLVDEISSMLEEVDSAEGVGEDVKKESASFIEPLNRLKTAHEMATVSNTELHRAMALQRDYFELMSKPIEEVRRALPSVQAAVDACDRSVVDRLRYVVSKVEEMRQQRSSLESQLRTALNNDDITSKVVAVSSEPNKVQDLFKKEMAKFEPTTELIHKNLAAQANILSAMTDANANFAELRQSVQIMMDRRQAHVKVLLDSLATTEELLAKANKGVGFYKRLNGLAETLLADVRKLHQRWKDEEAKKQQLQAAAAEKTKKSIAAKREKMGEEGGGMYPSGMDFPPSGADVADFGSDDVMPEMTEGVTLKDLLPFLKPKSFGGSSRAERRTARGSQPVQLPQQSLAAPANYMPIMAPPSSDSALQFQQPMPGPRAPLPTNVMPVSQSGQFIPLNPNQQAQPVAGYQGQQIAQQPPASFPTSSVANYHQQLTGYNTLPPASQQQPTVVASSGGNYGQVPQVQPNNLPPSSVPYWPASNTSFPQQHQQISSTSAHQPSCSNFQDAANVPLATRQQMPQQYLPQHSVPPQMMQTTATPSGPTSMSNNMNQPVVNSHQNMNVNPSHQPYFQPQQQLQMPRPQQQQPGAYVLQNPQVAVSAPLSQPISSQALGQQNVFGVGNQTMINQQRSAISNNTRLSQPPYGYGSPSPTPTQHQSGLGITPQQQPQLQQQQQRHFQIQQQQQQQHLQPYNYPSYSSPLPPSMPTLQQPQASSAMVNHPQVGPPSVNRASGGILSNSPTPSNSQSTYASYVPSPVQQMQPGNNVSLAAFNNFFQNPGQGQGQVHTAPHPSPGNVIYTQQPQPQQQSQPVKDLMDEPINDNVPAPPPLVAVSQQAPEEQQTADKAAKLPEKQNGEAKAYQQQQQQARNLTKNIAMVQPYNKELSAAPVETEISPLPISFQPEMSQHLAEPQTNNKSLLPFENEWSWDKVRANSNMTRHLRSEVSRLDSLITALDQSPTYLDKDLKILVEHQARECLRLTCSVAKCSPVTQNLSSDCLPYDFNRIKLKSPASGQAAAAFSPSQPSNTATRSSNKTAATDDDYINASLVDFDLGTSHVPKFIASQGPTSHTLAKFWQMIWQEHIETVITLLDSEHFQSFGIVSFWPSHQSTPLRCGDFEIHLKTTKDYPSRAKYPLWRERVLSVTCLTPPRSTRVILQMQFCEWPAKSPSCPAAVVEFVHAVRNAWALQRNRQHHPVLIHCSNGSGWTGVFLACFWLFSEIELSALKNNNWPMPTSTLSPFDLLCFVRRLRSQRRGSVQERCQLRHLYDVFSTGLHHILGDNTLETPHLQSDVPAIIETAVIAGGGGASGGNAKPTPPHSATSALEVATATISDIENLLSGLTFPVKKPAVAESSEKTEDIGITAPATIEAPSVLEQPTVGVTTAESPIVNTEPIAIVTDNSDSHKQKDDETAAAVKTSVSPIASILENPSLFSLEDQAASGQKSKQRITKASFLKRQAEMQSGPTTATVPSQSVEGQDQDPLCGLDPLWKVRSTQQPI